MSDNKMKKVSLLIYACLLSGCSLLGNDEPLPLYILKSKAFESSNALSVPLAIEVPLSEASLNTSRIAVTPSSYQRNYLADGAWPERLPKIFQKVLLEGLSQRWGETYVNRMSMGLKTKYVLQSEIQDFSAYDLDKNTPTVYLKVSFKLIDFHERQVIAAKIFSETTPVSSPTMQGIVGAFNQGVHCLLEKIVPWMEDVFLKESLLNSRKNKLCSKGR